MHNWVLNAEMMIAAQAEVLSPVGVAGLLATVFVLFYIDSIIFPTLPELFTVIIFIANPTILFAVGILCTIVLAEFLGFNTLYYIVKRIRVPKIIQKAATRYCQFLLVNDEKVILVNRVAPLVPFIGAFAALEAWDWGKCVLYTFIGGVLKYGAILAMSNIFYTYLSSGVAQWVTIGLILVVIAVSFVYSFFRRKRVPEACNVEARQAR
jgi:hypothetical protein